MAQQAEHARDLTIRGQRVSVEIQTGTATGKTEMILTPMDTTKGTTPSNLFESVHEWCSTLPNNRAQYEMRGNTAVIILHGMNEHDAEQYIGKLETYLQSHGGGNQAAGATAGVGTQSGHQAGPGSKGP